MPNETNLTADEEIREINLRISKIQEETAKNQRKASEFYKEAVELQKEAIKLSNENKRRINELTATSKNHGQQIGGYGNKFGDFTEAMAEPSIRRILDEYFEADYRKRLEVKLPDKGVALEIDGWGVARNGTKAAYLVEVKSRFKPEYIEQVLRHVEQFRKCFEQYRHHEVYPIVAAVQISDEDRRLVWKAGIHLIDIADGVFELTKPPAQFNPNGYHGLEGVRRAVPPLRLVRSVGVGTT